jgi:hypothetical protein
MPHVEKGSPVKGSIEPDVMIGPCSVPVTGAPRIIPAPESICVGPSEHVKKAHTRAETCEVH